MQNQSIKLVKLVTGEEFFATVEDCNDFKVFKNPCVVGMHPETGQPMILPWPMLSKSETLNVKEDHIVFIADLRDDIAQVYTQAVTGIMIAPANALDKKGKLVV